jgi:hypothetical protein
LIKPVPVIGCRGDIVMIRDSDVGESTVLQAHRRPIAHIKDSFTDFKVHKAASAEKCTTFMEKCQRRIVSCEC